MEKIELYQNEDNIIKPTEDLKSLYSNINFIKKDIKLLSIISSVDLEGKTYIAKELAKLYAGNGLKTCYLDCDLHKEGPYKEKIGLSEYLNDINNIEDIVYNTMYNNLYIIPSGALLNETVYLFNKTKFQDLLNKLKEDFDMVIIDTPSINTFIDGSIIASKTEGSLFVIKGNSTKRKEVLNAKAQLNRAKVNVIGVCLNKIEKE